MIERYTRPDMGAIWSDENKYKIWLEIEILASEAQAELGHSQSHQGKNGSRRNLTPVDAKA